MFFAFAVEAVAAATVAVAYFTSKSAASKAYAAFTGKSAATEAA